MRTTKVAAAAVAAVLVSAGAAQAATPELSTSNRLQDRREVASGQRSYVEGFQDGRFYANGWHITGEMGGVWTQPLKLLDGIWFKVGDDWVGPATRFSSGWGYTRFDFPDAAGLKVERTDVPLDAHRAVLFGLKLTNGGDADKTVPVAVDAHSELMTSYPWGGTTPSTKDTNQPDHGTFTGTALRFTDGRKAAFVGADATPTGGEAADTGGAYRGDQGDTVCAADDGKSAPSACDDGPYGRGTGGRLRYEVKVPAGDSKTLWVAVGGDEAGWDAAKSQMELALKDPAGQVQAKIAKRRALADHTKVDLPGDPLLADAVEWGKQNLADLTQTAKNLRIRWTNQGKQYPPALGTIRRINWFGAGFPDYPWLFATDGEYTTFAAMAVGQFEAAKAHMIALRDVSDLLNNRSGIVAHEVVPDGSVYFGHDSVTTKDDGTQTNDFNTDETIKFPSVVALIWRWTGDNAFRDELYDFAVRNLKAVDSRLDVDRDGWPEGSGNVERPGMGPEKLDNGVYYVRALLDLADMARSKGDRKTRKWAEDLAAKLQKQFENDWWDTSAGQYADSLIDPGNQQSFQKHWIGSVPMEAELVQGTKTTPGVASRAHGVAGLRAREDACFSGTRPGSLGLFHTGCGGGADGKGDFEIFSLTTSIQAVGEGNYGRLGDDQQRRYTDANAETMFSEPATGGEPDEQPGAMPEIFPSSPNGDPSAGIPANIDRCWTCRSMVMQAWGNYGTMWPVVHQQLGLRPYLNRGLVEVVPQVPEGQPRVAGSDIRLGSKGSIDIVGSTDGVRYRTKVDATDTPGFRLRIGATLPRSTSPGDLRVRLDGVRVKHARFTKTNRGLEVWVPTDVGTVHTLVVRSRA